MPGVEQSFEAIDNLGGRRRGEADGFGKTEDQAVQGRRKGSKYEKVERKSHQ